MLHSCIGARRRASFVFILAGAGLFGCENIVYTDLRVYESPYAGVDWSSDYRLKAQHHDHMADRPERVIAYDAAGYDVLSLMDYSGDSRLKFALPFRLWPPEERVPLWVRGSLKNVKFFIPNAEEVGLSWQHVTSPFMTTFIEPYYENPDSAPTGQPPAEPLPWEYTSREEMFTRIREYGGLPCFAHPWNYGYDNVRGTFCVEIYNAYGAAERSWGDKAFTEIDRNEELVKNWDYALQGNQRIYGIAVNDHFGPNALRVSAEIRDSGKIIVLAASATPRAYEARFRQGAFLAVKDVGETKDEFPQILSIVVESTFVFIEAFDRVTWISQGTVIAEGRMLLFKDLPVGARYVRAEIVGATGSTVYTQPFVVRPIGDVDGDYDVDADDDAACTKLVPSSNGYQVILAACQGTGH